MRDELRKLYLSYCNDEKNCKINESKMKKVPDMEKLESEVEMNLDWFSTIPKKNELESFVFHKSGEYYLRNAFPNIYEIKNYDNDHFLVILKQKISYQILETLWSYPLYLYSKKMYEAQQKRKIEKLETSSSNEDFIYFLPEQKKPKYIPDTEKKKKYVIEEDFDGTDFFVKYMDNVTELRINHLEKKIKESKKNFKKEKKFQTELLKNTFKAPEHLIKKFFENLDKFEIKLNNLLGQFDDKSFDEKRISDISDFLNELQKNYVELFFKVKVAYSDDDNLNAEYDAKFLLKNIAELSKPNIKVYVEEEEEKKFINAYPNSYTSPTYKVKQIDEKTLKNILDNTKTPNDLKEFLLKSDIKLQELSRILLNMKIELESLEIKFNEKYKLYQIENLEGMTTSEKEKEKIEDMKKSVLRLGHFIDNISIEFRDKDMTTYDIGLSVIFGAILGIGVYSLFENYGILDNIKSGLIYIINGFVEIYFSIKNQGLKNQFTSEEFSKLKKENGTITSTLIENTKKWKTDYEDWTSVNDIPGESQEMKEIILRTKKHYDSAEFNVVQTAISEVNTDSKIAYNYIKENHSYLIKNDLIDTEGVINLLNNRAKTIIIEKNTDYKNMIINMIKTSYDKVQENYEQSIEIYKKDRPNNVSQEGIENFILSERKTLKSSQEFLQNIFKNFFVKPEDSPQENSDKLTRIKNIFLKKGITIDEIENEVKFKENFSFYEFYNTMKLFRELSTNLKETYKNYGNLELVKELMFDRDQQLKSLIGPDELKQGFFNALQTFYETNSKTKEKYEEELNKKSGVSNMEDLPVSKAVLDNLIKIYGHQYAYVASTLLGNNVAILEKQVNQLNEFAQKPDTEWYEGITRTISDYLVKVRNDTQNKGEEKQEQAEDTSTWKMFGLKILSTVSGYAFYLPSRIVDLSKNWFTSSLTQFAVRRMLKNVIGYISSILKSRADILRSENITKELLDKLNEYNMNGNFEEIKELFAEFGLSEDDVEIFSKRGKNAEKDIKELLKGQNLRFWKSSSYVKGGLKPMLKNILATSLNSLATGLDFYSDIETLIMKNKFVSTILIIGSIGMTFYITSQIGLGGVLYSVACYIIKFAGIPMMNYGISKFIVEDNVYVTIFRIALEFIYAAVATFSGTDMEFLQYVKIIAVRELPAILRNSIPKLYYGYIAIIRGIANSLKWVSTKAESYTISFIQGQLRYATWKSAVMWYVKNFGVIIRNAIPFAVLLVSKSFEQPFIILNVVNNKIGEISLETYELFQHESIFTEMTKRSIIVTADSLIRLKNWNFLHAGLFFGSHFALELANNLPLMYFNHKNYFTPDMKKQFLSYFNEEKRKKDITIEDRRNVTQ